MTALVIVVLAVSIALAVAVFVALAVQRAARARDTESARRTLSAATIGLRADTALTWEALGGVTMAALTQDAALHARLRDFLRESGVEERWTEEEAEETSSASQREWPAPTEPAPSQDWSSTTDEEPRVPTARVGRDSFGFHSLSSELQALEDRLSLVMGDPDLSRASDSREARLWERLRVAVGRRMISESSAASMGHAAAVEDRLRAGEKEEARLVLDAVADVTRVWRALGRFAAAHPSEQPPIDE